MEKLPFNWQKVVYDASCGKLIAIFQLTRVLFSVRWSGYFLHPEDGVLRKPVLRFLDSPHVISRLFFFGDLIMLGAVTAIRAALLRGLTRRWSIYPTFLKKVSGYIFSILKVCKLVENFGCIFPAKFRKENWELGCSELIKDIITWRNRRRSKLYRSWVYVCLLIRAALLISDTLRVFALSKAGKMLGVFFKSFTRK